MTASWEIRQGDALEHLRQMPAESVQCCVTSPPYFGLRDYATDGQIGLESSPDEYAAVLVRVFREVRRVLRADGTLWLNLGDSYASGGGAGGQGTNGQMADRSVVRARSSRPRGGLQGMSTVDISLGGVRAAGCKPKDLLGIPWLVAFALRADGWWLRSDIIWSKPNPMPESVTDRPTNAHEHIFLLTRSPRYFYDAYAIREPHSREWWDESVGPKYMTAQDGRNDGGKREGTGDPAGRNKRNVWEIATQPYAEAHFATFPPKLVEPCVLAGTAPKACGECGSPWRRILDKGENPYPGSSHDHTADLVGTGAQRHHSGTPSGTIMANRWRERQGPQPMGWEATCKHDDDTSRSVVLDPFAGAGTTGVVALRRDRSFIGIELNPAYADMARERLRWDAPLLNIPAEVAA